MAKDSATQAPHHDDSQAAPRRRGAAKTLAAPRPVDAVTCRRHWKSARSNASASRRAAVRAEIVKEQALADILAAHAQPGTGNGSGWLVNCRR